MICHYMMDILQKKNYPHKTSSLIFFKIQSGESKISPSFISQQVHGIKKQRPSGSIRITGNE